MNKLNLHPPSPTLPGEVQINAPAFARDPLYKRPERERRFIVLIPTDFDPSAATRRIWELAHATGMHVRLLGLCKDAAQEPGLHRELITMASLLQDGKVTVETKVNIGTSWMEIVSTNYEAGDVLVCFAEQQTGLLRKPLSQILEANFKATIYVLSGLAPQKSKSSSFPQIIAWLGCLGIILGFGILQTKIVQLPEDWLQSTLLILSIIPEFGLIWIWNSLFG
jgi:hypothetical protein